MNKYKKYKESEHIGIGEVPEHWKVKRMKQLGNAIIGVTYSPNDVSDNDEGLLVLRSSNIQDGVIAFEDCVYLNKKVDENLITKKGDILICARNGSAHLVGKNICIDEKSEGFTFGAFMTIFRGKYWRYLSYFFNSPIFSSQTGMFSTTTINQLTSQTLNNLRIAYPACEEEQNIICDYLDEQTQKIDQLINNKKAQAEKLKELRQIEINNAVTKGLNPNVEMKDSGIDWLGEIPMSWEVKRLKNVAHVNQNVINEKTNPNYEIKYIDIGNVTSNGQFLEIQEMTFSEAPSRARRKPKHNSVILSTVRTYLRAIAFIENPDENLIASTGFAVIDSFENLVDARYLYFQMISHIVVERVIANSEGVSYPAISSTKLGDIKIIIPPKTEQENIASYLKKRMAGMDRLIRNIDVQTEKLQELRKIKIYEAVTGKIKVVQEPEKKQYEPVS